VGATRAFKSPAPTAASATIDPVGASTARDRDLGPCDGDGSDGRERCSLPQGCDATRVMRPLRPTD